jgi:hypothetical protein
MQTITKKLISPFTTDMKEHKDLFRTAYVSTADVQTITRLQYGRNQTPHVGHELLSNTGSIYDVLNLAWLRTYASH